MWMNECVWKEKEGEYRLYKRRKELVHLHASIIWYLCVYYFMKRWVGFVQPVPPTLRQPTISATKSNIQFPYAFSEADYYNVNYWFIFFIRYGIYNSMQERKSVVALEMSQKYEPRYIIYMYATVLMQKSNMHPSFIFFRYYLARHPLTISYWVMDLICPPSNHQGALSTLN